MTRAWVRVFRGLSDALLRKMVLAATGKSSRWRAIRRRGLSVKELLTILAVHVRARHPAPP